MWVAFSFQHGMQKKVDWSFFWPDRMQPTRHTESLKILLCRTWLSYDIKGAYSWQNGGSRMVGNNKRYFSRPTIHFIYLSSVAVRIFFPWWAEFLFISFRIACYWCHQSGLVYYLERHPYLFTVSFPTLSQQRCFIASFEGVRFDLRSGSESEGKSNPGNLVVLLYGWPILFRFRFHLSP